MINALIELPTLIFSVLVGAMFICILHRNSRPSDGWIRGRGEGGNVRLTRVK